MEAFNASYGLKSSRVARSYFLKHVGDADGRLRLNARRVALQSFNSSQKPTSAVIRELKSWRRGESSGIPLFSAGMASARDLWARRSSLGNATETAIEVVEPSTIAERRSGSHGRRVGGERVGFAGSGSRVSLRGGERSGRDGLPCDGCSGCLELA